MALDVSVITRLVGVFVLIFALLGLWGGLAVNFEFYNPLGDFTLGIFGFTSLFFSDLAGLIFWFIIILLGFALISPRKKGYSGFIGRRR